MVMSEICNVYKRNELIALKFPELYDNIFLSNELMRFVYTIEIGGNYERTVIG